MMTGSTNHSTDRSGDDAIQLIRELQDDPENEALKSELVINYTPLVHSLARKFSRDRGLQEDLIQVGMIGLLAALRRFDPDQGNSFESFAIPTIVGEIKRYIRDKTWSVHVPRRIKELGPKIKRAVDELTNRLGHSPTVEEIARHIHADEEDVLETMELGRSYKAASVDSRIEADAEGGTVTLLDLIGTPEAGYEQINEKLLMEKIFGVLTEREKKILIYTYFENLSQKETGERLDISQMHVSRLQRRALKKLREALKADETEVIK
ncbi:RNA polymerase sigma-B factor [Pullulanibacillus pueri]|uniref:RNA polymerase sigma factor n=1 Tax=Pullulanibacillus pueri TaxID=1437324 RepID=A0A8J3EQD7_9BACL|nr:RNA polymerase sigma factor SigB [Pullulanibacillus pueri]MBM7683790.1 RNA polymerase sigma-B factor [Pullulanibacillus pueri]GGH87604.1 RNA polymerase sigma factor [Pullulanibacillus pueri]